MTQEQLLKELLVLREVGIFSIVVSLIAFFYLIFKIKKLKIQSKKAKWTGLFVGLGGKSMFMLSTAWIKLTIFIGILIFREYITITHLALILYLTIFMIILKPSVNIIIMEMFSTGLLYAGITVANTLSSYLKQIRFEWGMQISYWLLTILLIIAILAVFVKEVTTISSERNYFDENGETE